MTKISAPQADPSHPDYDIDCERALQRAFDDLVSRGEAAGWHPESVVISIQELAAERANTLDALAASEDAVKALGRKH